MSLIAILLVYLAPAIIAYTRKHKNAGSILVIDLFLGWTLLGWVVALAMAVSSERKAPA